LILKNLELLTVMPFFTMGLASGAGVLGGGDAVRISGLAKGIYIVNGKRIMVY
jgi:hypothetical protein